MANVQERAEAVALADVSGHAGILCYVIMNEGSIEKYN